MLRIVAPLAIVNSLFSQDPARHNAASAAGRLIAARQERLEVDAYLRAHSRRGFGQPESVIAEPGQRADASGIGAYGSR